MHELSLLKLCSNSLQLVFCPVRKMKMKSSKKVLVSACLSLLSGASFAGTLSVTPAATQAPQAGGATFTTPHAVVYTQAASGEETNNIQGRMLYNSAILTATVTTGATNCSIPAAGEIVILTQNNDPAVLLPSGNLCEVAFVSAPASPLGATSLNLTFDPALLDGCVTGVGAPVTTECTLVDGSVEIVAVSSPTVAYSPAPDGPGTEIAFLAAALGSTQTISVTADATGGTAGQSVSISNCSVTGTGLTLGSVSPALPATIANGDAAGDVDLTLPVSCLYGAAARTGALTCTETPTTGSAATRTWDIGCPAGDPTAPVFSSVPAPGSTLNCDGEAGTTETTSVTVTNSGDPVTGGPLTFTCTAAGAGFSISSGGSSAGLAVGASQVINIGCVVPAEGDPASTGTLSCTTNAGAAPTYLLSSLADTLPDPVPQPNVVPASSLWSKLALIGLLAGLGIAVVGFRRS
jgi:hypothetical protein